MKKILFSVLIILNMAIYGFSQIHPISLVCEYIANPLGIDVQKPRLSWKFTATNRNQTQSAYEIIVSDNAQEIQQNKGSVWQTGKISTDQNVHIEYAGQPLKAFTKYFWRVKGYDKNGIASAWSSVATFETAAFKQSDWTAPWIGDGRKQFEKDEDFYQNASARAAVATNIFTSVSIAASFV